MTWLVEIFSDSSDQARAVTALFVAIVALLVVFITQQFNSRRARKEKLIEKLEEVYILIIRISDRSNEIGSSIFENTETPEAAPIKEKYIELNKDVDLAKMISYLYFNTLTDDVDAIKKSLTKICISYERYKEENPDYNFVDMYSHESSIILNSLENLHAEMNIQIKKIMH